MPAVPAARRPDDSNMMSPRVPGVASIALREFHYLPPPDRPGRPLPGHQVPLRAAGLDAIRKLVLEQALCVMDWPGNSGSRRLELLLAEVVEPLLADDGDSSNRHATVFAAVVAAAAPLSHL